MVTENDACSCVFYLIIHQSDDDNDDDENDDNDYGDDDDTDVDDLSS